MTFLLIIKITIIIYLSWFYFALILVLLLDIVIFENFIVVIVT